MTEMVPTEMAPSQYLYIYFLGLFKRFNGLRGFPGSPMVKNSAYQGEGWGERIIREFEVDIYTLLYLK